MRTFLTKAAATLLTLCLMWPQGVVFAAAPAEGQGELDTLLKSSKPKVVVFDGIEVTDDRVTMKLSGKAKHQTQLLSDPPRILVDLYGTDYQVGVKVILGKGSRIKGVRGQYKGARTWFPGRGGSEAMPYSWGTTEQSGGFAGRRRRGPAEEEQARPRSSPRWRRSRRNQSSRRGSGRKEVEAPKRLWRWPVEHRESGAPRPRCAPRSVPAAQESRRGRADAPDQRAFGQPAGPQSPNGLPRQRRRKCNPA